MYAACGRFYCSPALLMDMDGGKQRGKGKGGVGKGEGGWVVSERET